MISTDVGSAVIRRIPVNEDECILDSWKIAYKQSHILHSQCSKDGKCIEKDQDKCKFCLYTSLLDLPHMPDMVFPNNVLTLKHPAGIVIEFNPLDALKIVSNGRLGLTVACSEAWKESRQGSNNLKEVNPFDWTFTTDYKGTVIGVVGFEPTEQRIDLDKLRRKEQILFYHDLTLFEDELHDNGIAVMSVKIRVMPSSFFVLLRYFLRVDGVMLRVNDTRYFYEKGRNHVLREYTSRESKVTDLKVPPSFFIDPSKIAPHLPLTVEMTEKLILPTDSDT